MANSWPSGVSLITARWGKGFTTLAQDVAATLHLETLLGTGNEYLVWSATGDPWLPFPVDRDAPAGVVGEVLLPAVDQDGWIDPHGNAIKNWHYRATISYSANGQNVKIIRNVYPLVGQPVIDLDVIPDGGDSAPVVVLQTPVRTVNGTGPDASGNVPVTFSKSAAGLGNVDNTSDANKPVSTATATALQNKADLVGGLIPTSQIPSLALTAVVTVASQAAMLALTTAQVQPGDIAIRTDGAGSFILTATNPATLANWTLLASPAGGVSSVNGQSGAVVLSAANVGAEPAFTTLDYSKVPAGTVGFVSKTGSTWPARPSARADIMFIWKGADPSPAIVSSGTAGMLDNVDVRFVS